LASPPKIMFAFRHKDWNGIPDLRVIVARVSRLSGKVTVASREYFACQAATLLKYAKSTSDPKIAAALVEMAAELKSQVDGAPDRSPQAPDIEPPPAR